MEASTKPCSVTYGKIQEQYLTHLPTCNKMQNWDEAFQALADTPKHLKDYEWQVAYEETVRMSNTCTCGLDKFKADKK